jgi:hypothetical protein
MTRAMIKQSDYVVTHITHSWGGTAQFAEQSMSQKKHDISLLYKIRNNHGSLRINQIPYLIS